MQNLLTRRRRRTPQGLHIGMLGDSIFDNGGYVKKGEPDVGQQVNTILGDRGYVTMLARDGATTHTLEKQLVDYDTSIDHLVVSIGGNDALRFQGIVDQDVTGMADALLTLAVMAERFDANYQDALGPVLDLGKPVTVCTVYNGNFFDDVEQILYTTALTLINDVIIQYAFRYNLGVIDLRQVCDREEHYANPIEPSAAGGQAIAEMIVSTVLATPR